MKELFYSDYILQKDLDFCDFVKELRDNQQVFIIKLPEEYLVHEMKRVNRNYYDVFKPDRIDTGKTHVGFWYHYVTFAYKGFIFYMQGSDYYPFTDDNFPGRFNFTVYKRIGLTGKVQCTFANAYEGLRSIDDWLKLVNVKSVTSGSVRGSCTQPITMGVTSRCENNLKNAIRIHGGYREKSIMDQTPFLIMSETWNDDHHVIHVIADCNCDDGHRESFDFDLITNKICG